MFFSFLVLIASSFMISKSLFAYFGFKSTLFLRQLHTTSAYWFFLLGFIHLGIHWHRFSAFLQKKFRIHALFSHPFFIFLSVLIVLYAGVVFIQKEIASKLFMAFAFEFWDDKQTVLYVVMDYMSMVIALIVLTQYLLVFKRYQK